MNVKRMPLVMLLLAISVVATAQQPKEPAKSVSNVFTVNDANTVLARFRSALEAHSERQVFALFDGEKMTGYVSFQDQMRGFLTRNEGIRVNIRGIQASGDGDKGVITATFEIETTSRSGHASRRSDQLRLELNRTAQGWQIVDINPRSFFS
jgi:hypothetical protein